MTQNFAQNKEILRKLLAAKTQEEVSGLIENHPFFKQCGRKPYGGQPNNAGTIKAQAPDPVGALVEKITNGIDALLIRGCLAKNIDPESSAAPQSQKEAIRDIFGEKAANLDLSDREIRELAAKTVRIISEGNEDAPTLSVVDFGEGQYPQDFPKTFLSIGGSNKIKIKFAHGVYNQGGSAALKFCGNGYQLILSRRAGKTAAGQDARWGFSLVRERYEPGYKAEWYEYCVVDGEIPEIPYEPLKILQDDEVFESGSFVRLYSYTLRNGHFFITGQREKELAREINKRYFSMPLPIQLNELRTQLRGWSEKNKVTRIYGQWRLLGKKVSEKSFVRTVLPLRAELGVFGARTIEIVVLNDEGEDGQSYKSQPEKIFLTVNGQAQHHESVSFLKTKCLLPDLAPYMIIHIDLSNAGYKANKIFTTARKGVIEVPDYDEFHARLVNSIKGDETLKELNREYKERKLKNALPEDKDLTKYIGRLVQDNPFLASLLNIGEQIPTEKPKGLQKEYLGKYIPTIFELEVEEKIIPCNRYARVRMKTDAVNDYLTRGKDRGKLTWTSSKVLQMNQFSLRDGYIPVRLEPAKNAKVGDVDVIKFELTRPNLESLHVSLNIAIGEFEEPKVNPPGSPKEPTRRALKLPKKELIQKSVWDSEGWTSPVSDKKWSGLDIAEVGEDQDGITVYINEEPDVLVEFPKRNPKYQAGDMMATIKKHYLASVYLYALAMFFEMKDDPERREWAIPNSMRAISKFILDLAFTSRMQQLEED